MTLYGSNIYTAYNLAFNDENNKMQKHFLLSDAETLQNLDNFTLLLSCWAIHLPRPYGGHLFIWFPPDLWEVMLLINLTGFELFKQAFQNQSWLLTAELHNEVLGLFFHERKK